MESWKKTQFKLFWVKVLDPVKIKEEGLQLCGEKVPWQIKVDETEANSTNYKEKLYERFGGVKDLDLVLDFQGRSTRQSFRIFCL